MDDVDALNSTPESPDVFYVVKFQAFAVVT